MSGYSLLSGVRVLEVAQLAPSSVGGHLADLGAEVIKIEAGPVGDPVRVGGNRAIGGPSGDSFMHLRWNRGKKSVEMDLRTDEGKKAFLDLVAVSDCVIEGMRDGYLAWLGVGYDEMRRVNPKIVVCSVSGMGEGGPYEKLGTGGPVFDAFAGIRDITIPEDPPVAGFAGGTATPIAMYAIGAYGAMALLAALQKAGRTGEGAHVGVAGIDIAAAWMPDRGDAMLNHDRSEHRPTWLPDGRLPDWPRLEAYETGDGKQIVLGAHVEKFWRNFLTAVDRADLAEVDLSSVDADAPARAEHVWRELTTLFRTRTRGEWLELFIDADVAGGPVNSTEDMLDDPHFRARGGTFTAQHATAGEMEFIKTPIRVSGEEFSTSLPGPVGAETDEVMRLTKTDRGASV